MNATIKHPGTVPEMPQADLEELRLRCLQRVNGDREKADRLVAAYLRGRAECDARSNGWAA